MDATLLPVKRFPRSKQRLAGWLTPDEREELARTMFEDVWETLSQWRGFGTLLVITAEPYVRSRCERDGVACREEEEQVSHSDSVARATRWAMDQGVQRLLSLPIDTPAMSGEELTELAGYAASSDVVIVPSGDGTGTNALLRTPPDAIAPLFGPGSCRRHAEAAEAAGRSHCIARIPGLMADIDTPEEVERFLKMGRRCRTAELLKQFLRSRPEVGICS